MKFTSVVSSCAIGLTLSSLLHGCGDSGGTDTDATTTPSPTTAVSTPDGTSTATTSGITSTSSTSTATTSSTTSASHTPADKDTIYVVLRMDDIAAGDYVADRQTDAIEWALEKKVKFNFGLIATDWPTDCSSGCASSPSVKALFDAYDNGDILGTGGSELLEIGCHSWDHEGWPGFYENRASVKKDLKKAMDILNAAYPRASIRTLTPPQNLATLDVLKVAADHGMDILTSQGTMSCEGEFVYFPCEDCRPTDDIFVTSEGFQQVTGTNVFSTPTGSANSEYPNADIGISAKDALGVDDCGCRSNAKDGSTICSLVANANGNALKSNGLKWTVHMMHPQTQFPGGGSYRKWLDEFHKEVQASGLDVQFIHFQDLVTLMSPAAESVTI